MSQKVDQPINGLNIKSELDRIQQVSQNTDPHLFNKNSYQKSPEILPEAPSLKIKKTTFDQKSPPQNRVASERRESTARQKKFKYLCPQCHTEIHTERSSSLLICSCCGWTHSIKNQELSKKMDKKFQRISISISLLLIVAFIQSMNWDNYFLRIIPLKIKFLTHTATSRDLNSMIKICTELKKEECLVEVYQRSSEVSPSTDHLSQYGRLLTEMNDDKKAQTIYQMYFTLGGSGVEEAYAYAKLLTKDQKVKEAISYFDYILKSKSSITRINATRDYIQLLMNTKMYPLAKKILLNFQKENQRNNYFMTKELKEINQMLNSKTPIS